MLYLIAQDKENLSIGESLIFAILFGFDLQEWSRSSMDIPQVGD